MKSVNYVAHHRSVYFKMSEDDRLSPYHLSVYNALFMLWNECGFADKLSINRNDVMRLSKIGNQNTYTKVLKQLNDYGYILYEPSFNPLKGSLVTIIRCDKGTDKGSVKGGSKGTDKGGDTLYKHINIETLETNKHALLFEWIDYRKSIKKKIQVKTINTIIDEMNKHSLDECQEVISKSIMSGWQGLFWNKLNKQNNNEQLRQITSAARDYNPNF